MATEAKIYTTNTDDNVVLGSVTIADNSTCLFSALVQKIDGSNVTPSDVSSATYTILDMTSDDTPTAVTGHDEVTLTVSSVFFTPTVVTLNKEDVVRNFSFTPSRATSEPFPDAGVTYRIRIDIELTSGFVSPLIFEVLTSNE